MKVTIEVPLHELIGSYIGQPSANVAKLGIQTGPGDSIVVVDADSLDVFEPFRQELIHALGGLEGRQISFQVRNPRSYRKINAQYPEIEKYRMQLISESK